MSDHTYEVEIKSLLGSAERAEFLREKLRGRGAEFRGSHAQHNHYFLTAPDLSVLARSLRPHLTEDKHDALTRILKEGNDHSIRTRNADGTIFFVAKASVGDDTSANGITRMEFEAEVALLIEALDQLLLDAGLSYQAKWSREREEYVLPLEEMNVTIDRNAGYGYLTEFEKVVRTRGELADARKAIEQCMAEFGIEELPQDRLDRMFAHYNEHWEDYYGTEKVFVIE